MKLAITTIFLFSLASITLALGCTSSEPPPEGFYCYKETDCAAHTDWPSESGHYYKLSGAAPFGNIVSRGLGQGSRIDLTALFNCSTIADVNRRLACEEYIEIRTNQTLTSPAKRFELDYSGPGYLEGSENGVVCDPSAGACPQEDAAPGMHVGIPAPDCCLFTEECALLLNTHPVIYDSDGDLWDQAYCCIARYEANCKAPQRGPEIDVCFPPTCSSRGCWDTLKVDPHPLGGAAPRPG